MKKQYIFPLTEVIPFATEQIMATDAMSNFAPADPLGPAPKRNKVEVF